MEIVGNVFKILNTEVFIASYIQNPNQPDARHFKPFRNVRVHLALAPPEGFPANFFPAISTKTNTNSNGEFRLNTGSLPYLDWIISNNLSMYIIAYRVLQTVEIPGSSSITIYGPIYRSQSFSLDSINAERLKIYVDCIEGTNDMGITQSEVNDEISGVADGLDDLESLEARIHSSHIFVEGEGRGATIRFDLKLKPDTSANLDTFLRHQIENYDIDLPFIDAISGLFVDESQIEDSIRDSVANITQQANVRLKDIIIQEISQRQNISTGVIQNVFNTMVTMTFEKVRYPVVQEIPIANLYTVKIRSIVPDPCIGLPRKLY